MTVTVKEPLASGSRFRLEGGAGRPEQDTVVWSTTGGVLIIDSDRTFAGDSPVCAYWLTRCEGFTVRSGRRELGVVESVAVGPLGLAETLHVHSRYKQRLIDAGQVNAVVPGRRLLIVEPAPARVRPLANSAAHSAGRALVFVSAQVVRLVGFLVPRVAAGGRVSAFAAARLTRDEVIPLVRSGLTVLIDEVERLTLLDGEPPHSPGEPQQRHRAQAQADRRERRNRTRELRQQARDEEEQLRVIELAEHVLP